MHVWDIATKTWFAQSTTVETGLYPSSDTAAYCSVVASAEDKSSHNIYLYIGGPDTTVLGVFILTLPAFHWVPVYPSASINKTDADYHYVVGHQCRKVHEKYMVVVRGYYDKGDQCGGDNPESMRFQGMTIFDMSSLTWTTRVELEDPKYLVPQALYDIIGGK